MHTYVCISIIHIVYVGVCMCAYMCMYVHMYVRVHVSVHASVHACLQKFCAYSFVKKIRELSSSCYAYG